MAARRLIAVLVVLLVISSIAAAVAPEARKAGDTSTDSTSGTTTTAPEAPGGPGQAIAEAPRRLERSIAATPAGKVDGGADPEPEQIEARPGDQLALLVSAKETIDIEIPAFGQFETAAENSPARFDLLLREPGSYAVRTVDGDELATIVVSAGKPEPAGQSATKKQPAEEPEPAPNPDTQAA